MKNTRRVAPYRLTASDAYTFLIKELEKVDEEILEPLSGTDWPRDLPVVTGGGLVENIAAIDVKYGSSGGDEDNIFFESANDIPVIQADMSKSVARVFNWAEYMSFSFLEQEKMLQVGRDVQMFLDKGIRLHSDKTLDQNAYVGFAKVSSVGLCNCPNITRAAASAHTSGGSDTTWAVKTADEILNDINSAISALWRDNDCSSDALPNHILIPVQQFGALVTRKVSDDADKSILNYVLENNLAKCQGVDLIISPCKWCGGAGANGSDRMVVYVNDVRRVCFNLTQPLRRMDTEYAEMRIKIPYFIQFSEVRFLYPSTVRYLDGI